MVCRVSCKVLKRKGIERDKCRTMLCWSDVSEMEDGGEKRVQVLVDGSTRGGEKRLENLAGGRGFFFVVRLLPT